MGGSRRPATHPGLGRWCALLAVTAAAATAGASTATGAPGTTPSSTAAACAPSPARTWRFGMSEARGTARPGTLWALFYGRRLDRRRAVLRSPAEPQPTKIIWRTGGTGGGATPSLVATGPDGRTLQPTDGPTPHMGSGGSAERAALEPEPPPSLDSAR